MKLTERTNIVAWMADAWTADALNSREHFRVALLQLCKHYVLCNGGDPKHKLDMMAEMDLVYNMLWKDLIKNGHPDNE